MSIQIKLKRLQSCKKMKSIVLGLGYGDEGKGLTTSFLCSREENPIVIRFNGGHQAGHTVQQGDIRHVFSNIGAGTLQGIPTYRSKFCTFHPTGFLRERKILEKAGVNIPGFYISPLCPVTTPYDILYNRALEKLKGHGSVGVGFGSTLERHEKYYKLHVQDLFYEKVLIAKINNIKNYYQSKLMDVFGLSFDESYRNILDLDLEVEEFINDIKEILPLISLQDSKILKYFDPIFEGAQGILLDMDFGFFPNVTRSNTTSKNAMTLSNCDSVYYVTRSYLTRHGAGFMPNEKKLNLINNERETNIQHEYQGNFRTAELDVDLINYALDCDSNFSRNIEKNLVITCMDQYPIDVDLLLEKIKTKFNNVYVSNGDTIKDIKKIR